MGIFYNPELHGHVDSSKLLGDFLPYKPHKEVIIKFKRPLQTSVTNPNASMDPAILSLNYEVCAMEAVQDNGNPKPPHLHANGSGVIIDEELLKMLNAFNHRMRLYFIKNKLSHDARYVAIEYIKAYNLFEVVKGGGKLPEHIARYIFRSICEEIYRIHRKGIFHSDIKLENILITKEGQVIIIDYGLARNMAKRDKERDRSYGGTIPYCSPEIIVVNVQNHYACDIFSLGVTLFALITTLLPFRDSKNDNSLSKCIHEHDFTSFWNGHRFKHEGLKTSNPLEGMHCTPELMDLFCQLMNVEPELRPTFSEIAAHPWVNGALPTVAEIQADLSKRYMNYYSQSMAHMKHNVPL